MNIRRPLAAWLLDAQTAPRHDQPTVGDALRARWLDAIRELGAAAAAEDAAQAWTIRLGCSIEEGRTIVARAWRTLALS